MNILINYILVLICLQVLNLAQATLNPLSVGVRTALASTLANVGVEHHNFSRKLKLHSHKKVSKYSDQEVQENGSVNLVSRGGQATEVLNFYENMVCGAVSRSLAQTFTHPANTMKTLLQSNRMKDSSVTLRSLARPKNLKMLYRGAGAQVLLSIPHGAVNFAVLEFVRKEMLLLIDKLDFGNENKKRGPAFGPLMDFSSSAVATICCSVISTPQMMIVDNIMAGTYPNLPKAIIGLSKARGIKGFYGGWWPGLAGKIPSYALTWTLFQQLKQLQLKAMNRPPKDFENSVMGCMASATSVCIMIPMDTIKTRLVTQMNYPHLVPYKGIVDCAQRVIKEEGVGTFYKGLAPRLISVVPMIGIQFGVYEFMKKVMISRRRDMREIKMQEQNKIERIIMEVAADDEQPFPVSQSFIEQIKQMDAEKIQKKMKTTTRVQSNRLSKKN